VPVSSFFRKVGKKASDNLVGVASGTTPIRGLDTPRFYRSIVLIGLIALGASGWLVYHHIVKATSIQKIVTINNANVNASALAALNALKTKDTDGDGISDYDELYSTHTSPYLKDSDGDGTPDGTEVQQGTDPNCPKGKTCEGFRLLTSITDQNGNLTPEFLRRSLAAAGVSQATLDATDDASLLRIYRQAVQSQPGTNTNSAATNANTNTHTVATNTNTGTTSNTNTGGSKISLEQLQQLTPTAIRTLLIQNGLDAATLSTVDDATLKQIFEQAISTSGQ